MTIERRVEGGKSPAVLISPALPFQSPPTPSCLSPPPICTRNLDWSVLVFVCACVCVYAEVIWSSVCPSLCAYISFVFIYLLMRLSITCQCGGARNSAVSGRSLCLCVFLRVSAGRVSFIRREICLCDDLR